MSEAEIAELGAAVAEDGLSAHDELVQQLAEQATSISPVAAGVLVSHAEPEVARLRAFAVVASALVRKSATPDPRRRGTVLRT